MPATLPAPVRHAASKATLQFDWLLGDRDFFHVAEIARKTGLSETSIEDYFKTAEKYHGYNFAGGKRTSMRIPRAFVVELLVRSARYSADEKREAVASNFREFAAGDLGWLRTRLDEELRRKA